MHMYIQCSNQIHMQTQKHVLTIVCFCPRACTQLQIMRMYICIYIHIYIHTHIYIHIYEHVLTRRAIPSTPCARESLGDASTARCAAARAESILPVLISALRACMCVYVSECYMYVCIVHTACVAKRPAHMCLCV